jgi:hypothetical protein
MSSPRAIVGVLLLFLAAKSVIAFAQKPTRANLRRALRDSYPFI